MIEYMFIAILVILGIVIMGPYVLRSVNAHFKLWDESVQDSATENLTQAPVNDVPILPINCTCHYVKGNCGGSGVGGQGACGANQREYDLDCGTSPQGCSGQPASECQDDNSCCTVYSPQGCGTTPIGTTPLPAGNCYYGQRIYTNQCPNFPIECETDATCDPTCIGIVSAGSLFCATNTTSPPSGLTQNYGVTYVADKPACPASPTCQLYCDTANSYVLNAAGTACVRTFVVAPVIDPCPGCKGKVVLTPNNQSFSMCVGAGTVITAVAVAASPPGQSTTTPIAIAPGAGEDGCQNPNGSGQNEGEPGDTCQVTLTS